MDGVLVYVDDLDGHFARAKAAGATGWLVKPFEPEQLIRVVQKVLGR